MSEGTGPRSDAAQRRRAPESGPPETSLSAEVPAAPTDQNGDETDTAILAAASEEFVRYGMRRANVEQIARRAGVSRVTVYRRFANKETLLNGVILAEMQDFVRRFDEVWYRAETAQEKIVEAAVLCVREIRDYPLLQSLVRSDPEQFLEQITAGGEGTFSLFRTLLAARMDELVEQGALPPSDTVRASEVLLRIGYTVLLMPYGLVPGETEEEVRATAREFILPIFGLAKDEEQTR